MNDRKVKNMNTTAAKSKIFSTVRYFIKPMIVTMTAFVLMMVTGFHIVTVEGASMNTTLESGEIIVVTNFLYTPQSGDIVCISQGAPLFKNIVKRVIAVEGQSIKLDYDNDKIYVDGKELDEPYLECSTFEDKRGNYDIPEVVPEGKIFVMGDNRSVSLDSRNSTVGFVDIDDVIGKAQFAVFPFDRFGGFDN